MKKLFLKHKKEESLLRFHPWVFSGAIASVEGDLEEGDIVDVYSADNRYLGTGHYQIGTIAVRILSFIPTNIDLTFWTTRLQAAADLRRAQGFLNNLADTNIFRLVNGEGDNLSGLIIDIYAHTAVIQAHSVGMHHSRKMIAEALQTVFGNYLHRIYYKSEGTLPFKAALENENGYLYGADVSEKQTALESGLTFNIDWIRGQKTGFFIDQRENRRLLMQYAHNCNVLNMFCYTGAFSVYALKGGAASVCSVDSSAKAIMLTDENVKANYPDATNHEAIAEDAFKYLETIDDKYDLIILDPPAFAKHLKALKNALQGYKRLNTIAIKKIRKGGLLFTFSCSQIVSKQDFRLAVFSAAAIAGRHVKILHQLTQPADHPINIYHPEGEYLKGLVLQID
jgi:23S rRNA (cytosine1962-C5)-methyltransferase